MLKFMKEYQIICVCDNRILIHKNMTYERFLEILMEGKWQVCELFEYNTDIIVVTIEPISYIN